MHYPLPKIRVEGVEVKKGLTAVEAAILAEIPLDRVLFMILYGLVKKGVIRVVSTERCCSR
jgi:hypothetical protein